MHIRLDRISRTFLAVLLLITLASCAGAGDWTYEDLPGDYLLIRANSRNIALLKRSGQGGTGTTIIPAYVSEISYTEQYIFVKHAAVPEEMDIPIDITEVDYYLIEVGTDTLCGPYDRDGFDMMCETLGIAPRQWQKTTDLPNRNFG